MLRTEIKLLVPAGDQGALPTGRMIVAASPVDPTPTASSAEDGDSNPIRSATPNSRLSSGCGTSPLHPPPL